MQSPPSWLGDLQHGGLRTVTPSPGKKSAPQAEGQVLKLVPSDSRPIAVEDKKVRAVDEHQKTTVKRDVSMSSVERSIAEAKTLERRLRVAVPSGGGVVEEVIDHAQLPRAHTTSARAFVLDGADDRTAAPTLRLLVRSGARSEQPAASSPPTPAALERPPQPALADEEAPPPRARRQGFALPLLIVVGVVVFAVSIWARSRRPRALSVPRHGDAPIAAAIPAASRLTPASTAPAASPTTGIRETSAPEPAEAAMPPAVQRPHSSRRKSIAPMTSEGVGEVSDEPALKGDDLIDPSYSGEAR
jgi:hypothetical protein